MFGSCFLVCLIIVTITKSVRLGLSDNACSIMGKYVDSNLVNGEKVVYEARYHWILGASSLLIAVLFWWLIIPLFTPIRAFLISKTNEAVVTNKRVIIKSGIIRRRVFDLQLAKVESVNVYQSILGRILGYGTITANGTGGSWGSIDMIRKPDEFRRVFQSLAIN